jgi:hypothetical protein
MFYPQNDRVFEAYTCLIKLFMLSQTALLFLLLEVFQLGYRGKVHFSQLGCVRNVTLFYAFFSVFPTVSCSNHAPFTMTSYNPVYFYFPSITTCLHV